AAFISSATLVEGRARLLTRRRGTKVGEWRTGGASSERGPLGWPAPGLRDEARHSDRERALDAAVAGAATKWATQLTTRLPCITSSSTGTRYRSRPARSVCSSLMRRTSHESAHSL